MFRSYRDMVRTPKPVEKSYSIKGYDCDLCNQGGWLSENDVEIHRKDVHFVKLNHSRLKYRDRFCSICMTLHSSRQELISHVKELHLLSSPNAKRIERKIYICDVCQNIFFNKDLFTAHMIFTHLTEKKDRETTSFTCPMCFKNVRLNSTWYHLQKHDVPSVSMCDICLTNLSNREELLEHLKTHPGYFKCDPCGINFNRDANFYEHLDSKHSRIVQIQDSTLKVVSRVFKSNSPTPYSRYNVHNSFKGLMMPKGIEICTLCREICLSKREVKSHIERDHMHMVDPVKKSYRCSCGEGFPYKVVLKQHIMKMKGSHEAVADKPDIQFIYVEEESNDYNSQDCNSDESEHDVKMVYYS